MLSAPIGQLNGAIQEYHYVEHRGVRTRPWRNPIVHLDSWAAGDEGSEPYLEQHQSRLYAPVRNPHYNDSNYRATVSLPGWAKHS